MWKIGDAEPVAVLTAFPADKNRLPHTIADLAVSPNGRFLVAVSDDGVAKMWETGWLVIFRCPGFVLLGV